MAIGITGANNGYSRPAADNRFIQTAGGTVTGNLTVTGTLSTTLLEALSANITVIDIKQYELSGFNVQGNATVQGSVSATGNIIGDKLGAGIVPTQLIHSYSASDANTGIRAQVGGSWIDIRGNNGSGHPGITTSTGVLDITSVIGGHGGIGTPLRVKQNSGSGGSNLQTWLSSNNTVLGIVDNTGRFGIGTATPNEKLTVVGNISATGDLSLSPASTIRTRIINSSDTSGFISFNSSRLYGNSWGINYTTNKITSTGFGFIAASVDFTDLFLERDSSNTLAQRNGTNAQESRIYSTYTNASNYERFFIKTNVGATSATQIGLSAAGTGQNRDLEFVVGGSTRMEISSSGNVGIGTTSPNEKLTVVGNISATGNATITGHLAASTKSFKIPHQTKSGYLQYGVVESNEHGVYVRGKTSDNTIPLPDHWDWLVHEDSVTTHLTPIGRPMNLYVIEQNNQKVTVGGIEGYYNYTIYGTRKDVPKLQIETEN